jgi:outer membrane protein TolC
VLGAPFFESSPKIELNQSLWRNGFGSETRAMENQLRAATVATQQGEILKQKFTLVEAEAAYWRLVLAREALKMSEETLLRAKKLSDWSERRAGLGLGDRSDALQGRAAVRLRQLQLQAAKDEERAARLAFNTARGTTGAGVPETLDDLANVQVSVSSDNQESFQGASGEKVPVREDLKAAEQALKIAEAASELGSARNTPTLDLFAGASLFAREAETSDAISGSFGTEQPQYGAGIKFVLPLDFSSMSHARAGYRRDIESAELALSRKRLELEQEWIDTRNKLNESLARLAVVRELEATQKEKSDYERDRLSRGRSTTYQALMFEDDYAQARLTRLRNQFEALALSVRLKSFQPLIQNADVSRNAGGKQE